MKNPFGWLIAACLLAACGSPDEGPEIRNFDALTKKETDAAFTVAPTSKSPAPFTVTSSDDKVATVDGLTITIRGAGTSTLTASQPRTGSFGPTTKTALLTVTAVACDSGQVRIGGKCEAVATCTAPATLAAATNKCVAPASSATSVAESTRSWMGASFSADYASARAFCEGTLIDGKAGWRLPTMAELRALYASGLFAGQNWVLGSTWTSTADTSVTGAAHATLNLANGVAGYQVDGGYAYLSCVR